MAVAASLQEFITAQIRQPPATSNRPRPRPRLGACSRQGRPVPRPGHPGTRSTDHPHHAAPVHSQQPSVRRSTKWPANAADPGRQGKVRSRLFPQGPLRQRVARRFRRQPSVRRHLRPLDAAHARAAHPRRPRRRGAVHTHPRQVTTTSGRSNPMSHPHRRFGPGAPVSPRWRAGRSIFRELQHKADNFPTTVTSLYFGERTIAMYPSVLRYEIQSRIRLSSSDHPGSRQSFPGSFTRDFHGCLDHDGATHFAMWEHGVDVGRRTTRREGIRANFSGCG